MYGIEGTALNWFKSYLKNRSQVVKINSTLSEKKQLRYGVPQGSILGPILFNSYIAPLSKIAEQNGIENEKFADDGQLAIAFKTKNLNTQQRAVTNMEKCIEDIRCFLKKKEISYNGDKTECSLFGTTQQLKKIKFDSSEVYGIQIQIEKKVKNLGVWFDSTLSMTGQVNKVCSLG